MNCSGNNSTTTTNTPTIATTATNSSSTEQGRYLKLVFTDKNISEQYSQMINVCIQCVFHAGIIITGGIGGPQSRSVQLLRKDGTTCTLPSLPSGRAQHSQSGLMACGGHAGSGRANNRQPGSDDTCVTFEDGQWVTSHILGGSRWGHVSWNNYPGLPGDAVTDTVPAGVLLMGGRYNDELSTQLLSPSSSTTSSFTLAHDIQ